jgi:hypothetical protein
MPLFHVLYAPVAAAVGERPDILLWMRIAVVPLYALCMTATYRIASSTFSPRHGLWAALLLALFPPFFLTSLEFRADTLAIALWLWALAFSIRDQGQRPRAFLAGLLFGGALAASIKTALLLGALSAGFLTVFIFRLPTPRPVATCLRLGAQAAAGFLLAVVILFSFIRTVGAWPQFLQCIVVHNFRAYDLWAFRPARLLLVVFVALCFIAYDSVVARSRVPRILAAEVLFVTGAVYFGVLNGISPIVNGHDFLALCPLLCIFVVPVLDRLGNAAGQFRTTSSGGFAVPIFLTAILVEVAFLLAMSQPWRDRAARQTKLLEDVLCISDADDLLFDLKGETIFRRRPLYPAFELVTVHLMAQGQIPDTIADTLVASRTYVTIQDSDRLPPDTRRFLNDNYVSVGYLRVAGKFLPVSGPGRRSSAFEIAIPGRYALVSPSGAAQGLLDGSRHLGPVSLDRGAHLFRSQNGEPAAVVWAQAAERGFSPFGNASARCSSAEE